MDDKIEIDVENLAQKLINTDEFQEMKSLKHEIDLKYKEEIKDFKEKASLYEEALKYGKYHPDLKSYQKQLSLAKEKLYSHKEVQRYLELERLNQNYFTKISNELSKAISNKFKVKKVIE